MTRILLLALMWAVILISCGDETGLEGDNILNYDGENATAPALPPGAYNVSIRFTSTLLRNVEGRTIDAVSYYLYERPTSASIAISYDDSPRVPSDPVYTQDITAQMQTNSWNTITLNTPFEITGQPIWIGIRMNLNDPEQTIGCDAGPGNPNGDWLYDAADMEWLRFEERVGESINWNIRAVLSP